MNDGVKRLQINGEERLLALRFINHVLCSRVPLYYDLLSGVPSLRSPSDPLVFLNYDTLKEPEEEKNFISKLRILISIITLFCRPFRKKYRSILIIMKTLIYLVEILSRI